MIIAWLVESILYKDTLIVMVQWSSSIHLSTSSQQESASWARIQLGIIHLPLPGKKKLLHHALQVLPVLCCHQPPSVQKGLTFSILSTESWQLHEVTTSEGSNLTHIAVVHGNKTVPQHAKHQLPIQQHLSRHLEDTYFCHFNQKISRTLIWVGPVQINSVW